MTPHADQPAHTDADTEAWLRAVARQRRRPLVAQVVASETTSPDDGNAWMRSQLAPPPVEPDGTAEALAISWGSADQGGYRGPTASTAAPDRLSAGQQFRREVERLVNGEATMVTFTSSTWQ